MFPLILLSGGESSRMGEPKGLVSVQGAPWIERQLGSYRAMGGARAVVVLGYARAEYERVLPWLVEGREPPSSCAGLKASVAVNPDPARGQFSSIQCGVRELIREGARAAFVLPIDVPIPDPGVWLALESAHMEGALASMPQIEGRGGHPVLLSSEFMTALEALSDDGSESRLDVQIRRLRPERVRRVSVSDPKVRMNINTPWDWQVFVRP